MALCPNCGYLTILNRRTGKWRCKRGEVGCGAASIVDLKMRLHGRNHEGTQKEAIQYQMGLEYPYPEIKYPEAYVRPISKSFTRRNSAGFQTALVNLVLPDGRRIREGQKLMLSEYGLDTHFKSKSFMQGSTKNGEFYIRGFSNSVGG